MQQRGILSVEACRKRQRPLKRDFVVILRFMLLLRALSAAILNKNKSANLCDSIICLNTHSLQARII